MYKSFLFFAVTLITACVQKQGLYNQSGVNAHFEKIRNDPQALRDFLYRFPKGGDIHNHIDGAVSAESWIKWSADDGKCIDLDSFHILLPPCDAIDRKPALAQHLAGGADRSDRIIDAFSMRNFQGSTKAAAEHFFSTFLKFHHSAAGREGDMLAEVTANAAKQNVYYLELMQSWNMSSARAFAKEHNGKHEQSIEQIAANTIALIDRAEIRKRQLHACNTSNPAPACKVEVRYIAQILRSFPRAQVRTQTQHAVQLIERDPRVVGLNFVAPEHDATSLADYRWQMKMIAEEAAHLPESLRNIALHAGELTPDMVAPEHLGFHVHDAINIAGAKRIGHAVELAFNTQPEQLLTQMAAHDIPVEINLSSNDIILGVSGADHPFQLFRQYNVPLTISTDDEAIARSDLTHEYQLAVENYGLEYNAIKQLARNALKYAFISGDSLFDPHHAEQYVSNCNKQGTNTSTEADCQLYLRSNKKAQLQWTLEKQFQNFEQQFKSH